MIQSFCLGVIFILSTADFIYKVKEYDAIDTNNGICIVFSLIGFLASLW
jgi:hypothetical protein